MASPSYTYTLTNGTTADASQVMQNFNDILNGVTDGTKDLSISALTCAGTATLNGNVNLGSATSDDITITGYVASSILPKTTASSDLGSTSQTWKYLYLDNGATDGGAIFMNAGTTQFIKCSADGATLTVDGFSNQYFDGNVSPLTDATYTLGDTTHNWVSLALDRGATDGGAVYFNAGTTQLLKCNAAGTDLLIDGFTTHTVDANIVPQTTSNNDLGSTSLTWKALYLDNGATDGGALYFDSGTTKFLKSDSSGADLDLGGFTALDLNATADVKGGLHYYAAVNNGSIYDEGDPVYSFTGDTNTGIYSEGADQLNLVTGGTSRIDISTTRVACNVIVTGPAGSSSTVSVGAGATNNGMYQPASDRVAWSAGGVAAMEYFGGTSNKGQLNLGASALGEASINGTVWIVESNAFLGMKNTATTGTFTYVQFFDGASSSLGSISCNTDANTTAYNTSSDRRLKTKFEEFSGIELLKKLKPLKYERISNPGVKEYGFVAQDVFEVLPQAVTCPNENDCGPKNAEKIWQMDYSKVTGVLARAIQELIERVEILEKKVG